MAEHRVVEPAVAALEGLAPELEPAADVLDRAAVQHQRDEAGHVLGRVERDEAVDERGRRRGPARRGLRLRLAQAPAPAVQRGLHRADGSSPSSSAISSRREVEELLQQHGGSLLGREPSQQGRAGVAQQAAGGAPSGGDGGRQRVSALRLPSRGDAARRSSSASPCAAGRPAGCRISWCSLTERARSRAAACPAPGPRRPTGCRSAAGSSGGGRLGAARSGRRSDARRRAARRAARPEAGPRPCGSPSMGPSSHELHDTGRGCEPVGYGAPPALSCRRRARRRCYRGRAA